ncbi:hypothetical protein BY996DRAFT_6516870 [Phakopsora pachyrhizi]|nr:hypothetical protein BY996DRAFT_6516870 [Phakopsora pachyrhizi]
MSHSKVNCRVFRESHVIWANWARDTKFVGIPNQAILQGVEFDFGRDRSFVFQAFRQRKKEMKRKVEEKGHVPIHFAFLLEMEAVVVVVVVEGEQDGASGIREWSRTKKEGGKKGRC